MNTEDKPVPIPGAFKDLGEVVQLAVRAQTLLAENRLLRARLGIGPELGSEGIIFADGPIVFPAACHSDVIAEHTSNAPIPIRPPAVDIEAVFAEETDVPDGWQYDGDREVKYRMLRPLRHCTLELFGDGEVVLDGWGRVTYPTLTEAWEVAQDIAKRLDAGEEVKELPPAKTPEEDGVQAVYPFPPTGTINTPDVAQIGVGALDTRLHEVEKVLIRLDARLSTMERKA